MSRKYCRYCQFMVCGDANYCGVKRRTYSTAYIKSTNNCEHFVLNTMDALFENKHGYRPRVEKKKEENVDQMSLF